MAFNLGNINFKNTNALLRQMLPYLMQFKMGEVSNQRIMDRQMQVDAEQERLMRERMAEAESISHRKSLAEQKINYENVLNKSILDAQENSPLDSYMETSRKFEVSGNQVEADKWMTRAMATLKEHAAQLVKVDTGKPMTEEDWQKIILSGGVGSAEKGISEHGTNVRFAKELPIKKMTAETSEGHLKLAREQADAEKRTGEKTTDYYKVMHSKISDVRKYLTSMKEFVESGADTSTIDIDWKKLLAGPMTPDTLGKALTKLSQYDTMSIRKTLTPEQEAWIDRAYDIAGIQQEVKTGQGLTSGVVMDFGGQSLTAPTTIPTTVSTTIPTTRPMGKDQHGFIIGEKRIADRGEWAGKLCEYLGNNQWKLAL